MNQVWLNYRKLLSYHWKDVLCLIGIFAVRKPRRLIILHGIDSKDNLRSPNLARVINTPPKCIVTKGRLIGEEHVFIRKMITSPIIMHMSHTWWVCDICGTQNWWNNDILIAHLWCNRLCKACSPTRGLSLIHLDGYQMPLKPETLLLGCWE